MDKGGHRNRSPDGCRPPAASPAEHSVGGGRRHNSLPFDVGASGGPLDASDASPMASSSFNTGSMMNNSVLWDHFETCAHSVAVLYRNPNWHTFQTAAAGCTQFYKDSVEAERLAFEHGCIVGKQRLLKDLAGYFRSTNSKTLRRDDLISFLTGSGRTTSAGRIGSSPNSSPVSRTFGQLCLQQQQHSLPSSVVGHGSPRSAYGGAPSRMSSLAAVSQHYHHHQPQHQQAADALDGSSSPLCMFHEALTLQSGDSSPADGSVSASTRTSPARRGGDGSNRQDLSAFLLNELSRNRKRPHSSTSTTQTAQGDSHMGGNYKRARRQF